jgi:hypothetical protein
MYALPEIVLSAACPGLQRGDLPALDVPVGFGAADTPMYRVGVAPNSLDGTSIHMRVRAPEFER